MYNTITMCNNNTTIQTVSVNTVYSLYIYYIDTCVYTYIYIDIFPIFLQCFILLYIIYVYVYLTVLCVICNFPEGTSQRD